MKNNAPCKDCDHRTAECHPACEKYRTYRAKQDEILQERTRIRQSTPTMPRKMQEFIWKELRTK